MVHHVDRVEARRLGRGGDLAQPRREASPRRRGTAERCSAEPQPDRVVPAAGAAAAAAPANACGDHPHRLGPQHLVEALAVERVARPPARPGAGAVSTSAGTRLGRARLRARHSAAGVSNGDRDARHRRAPARASASRARRSASSPSVSTTVVSPRRHPSTRRSRRAARTRRCSRRCRPRPRRRRRAAGRWTTTAEGGKCAAAHVDLPGRGRTRQHHAGTVRGAAATRPRAGVRPPPPAERGRPVSPTSSAYGARRRRRATSPLAGRPRPHRLAAGRVPQPKRPTHRLRK